MFEKDLSLNPCIDAYTDHDKETKTIQFQDSFTGMALRSRKIRQGYSTTSAMMEWCSIVT